MNRVVLRTLAYSDIFDYPLRADEIWEWQIADRERNVISKEDVKKILAKLKSLGYCQEKNGYYYLKGREKIVKTREQRKEFSKLKLNRARKVTKILSFIPWVKLIGVTGSLARKNAKRDDDIDLFFIVAKDRLWITRGIIAFILVILGLYRRPEKIVNMICPNMFVSENELKISPQNVFIAHEICQMVPLLDRDETYTKFLMANSWVKKFLPNGISRLEGPSTPSIALRINSLRVNEKAREQEGREGSLLLDKLESLARWIQLKYMQSRRTTEIVEPGRIRFHPKDAKDWILNEYQKRLEKLHLT